MAGPVLNTLALLAGIALIALTMLSVIRTIVLPRSAQDPISGSYFLFMRKLFVAAAHKARTFRQADRILGFLGPVAVLFILPVWMTLMLVGFGLLFWSTGVRDPLDAFVMSGSSLMTLGFASDRTWLHMALSFFEAMLGLILVALLISFLPTLYATFSRRESAVTQLDVRAGTPPSVVTMVLRAKRIGKLENGGQTSLWRDWELLFSEIEESHTSFPALVFFRSPKPLMSWVTAAGCVLDSAALIRSSLAIAQDPQADLCIRAGYLALRSVAEAFGVQYNPSPAWPDETISIHRAEYDAVYDELLAAGVPMVADREQAWRDFAGWRVNYDRVLVELAALVLAPRAPWSSDRVP